MPLSACLLFSLCCTFLCLCPGLSQHLAYIGVTLFSIGAEQFGFSSCSVRQTQLCPDSIGHPHAYLTAGTAALARCPLLGAPLGRLAQLFHHVALRPDTGVGTDELCRLWLEQPKESGSVPGGQDTSMERLPKVAVLP